MRVMKTAACVVATLASPPFHQAIAASPVSTDPLEEEASSQAMAPTLVPMASLAVDSFQLESAPPLALHKASLTTKDAAAPSGAGLKSSPVTQRVAEGVTAGMPAEMTAEMTTEMTAEMTAEDAEAITDRGHDLPDAIAIPALSRPDAFAAIPERHAQEWATQEAPGAIAVAARPAAADPSLPTASFSDDAPLLSAEPLFRQFLQPAPANPNPPMVQSPPAALPSPTEVQELQRQVESLPASEPAFGDVFAGSPAITIAVPSGIGADDWTGFVNFGFQSRTRFTDEADGTLGIGLGVGDARQSVGFQLSYTLASFGGSRDFGTGGFNAKLHRQFPWGMSVAVGWEGFITTGDVDFDDSVYGSVTQLLRLRPDLNDPFSRIALTAGVGNGRFRSEEDVLEDEDTVGVFGSVAVRVARPVSAIVEWTGQDLAAGLSITPFQNFPLVLTPAVRDITGAGDGARFVMGLGVSFQF